MSELQSNSEHSQKSVIFDEIISIKLLEPQQVYDLAIENTHNFIANDIIAHNTYLATKSGSVGIGTTAVTQKLTMSDGVLLQTLNKSIPTTLGSLAIG